MIVSYFYYFIIYAFLGYLCEVTYVSICNKKLTNRGYLYGPICPIYGYGAILILVCLNPIYHMGMWYLVFILGIILTSALEYITSYFMELIFHMRWWDYSNQKFNIKGRVCLKNSLLFGILVMAVFYGIQPLIEMGLDVIQQGPMWYILFTILVFFYIVDTVLSTIKNVNLTKMFSKMETYIDEFGNKIAEKSAQLKDFIYNTKVLQRLRSLSRKYPGMKVRSTEKKKRLSLKELIERILNDEE